MAKQDNKEDFDKAAYEQEIESLKRQLQEKQDAEETLLASNAELQNRLQSTEEDIEQERIIVTHEGKKYQALGKNFSLAGETHQTKDLKKNPDLVKALLDRKSGILKEM